MKKKNIVMVAGFLCLLASCNNSGEKKNKTTADSPMHKMDHTVVSTNEMKTLMDNMMMKMHQLPATGNNDIDFAAMMVEHHWGAVAMAKLELNQGNDSDLKQFAKKVIDAQEKEISFMTDFIKRAPQKTSPDAKAFSDGLKASMEVMMKDSVPSYKNIDKDFATQMIPHHQSAVEMAKLYLQYGTNSDLKKLSQNIINSQSKEIEWLETLVKQK